MDNPIRSFTCSAQRHLIGSSAHFWGRSWWQRRHSKSTEKEFAAFSKFALAVVPRRLKTTWKLDPRGLGTQRCLDVLLAERFCVPLGRRWLMGVLLANAEARLGWKSDLWDCLILHMYILSIGSNNGYSLTCPPDTTKKADSRCLS